MSLHIFRCRDSDHVIVDVSEEPVPHIQEEEQIWCPVCEEDVTGTYLGQDMSNETTIGNLNYFEDINLYRVDGDPYCIQCDGPCGK